MSTPTTIILCPGQGAQSIGMGKEAFDASPRARELLSAAGRVLGFDLAGLCLSGPIEKLGQTDMAQPALFAVGVASFHAAVEAGFIRPTDIRAVVGLSLGEYTALHLAGVFDFETGLQLVAARGRAMQDAAVATPSGMVAIMGADEAAIDKLCADCAAGDVLVPANFNAPGQIVVSGEIGACGRVVTAAEAAGFKAVALQVAGAFHSPLMQPGADRMKAELAGVTFSPPRLVVYSNVTGQPHGSDTEEIKHLLVAQIVKPVRWEQTMVPLAGEAGLKFVELSPGRTLAGLAKRVNRRLVVEGVSEKLSAASSLS